MWIDNVPVQTGNHSCGNYGEYHVRISESRTFASPDCRWRVNVRSSPGAEAAKGVLSNAKSGAKASFGVPRDSYWRWLKDNRFAVLSSHNSEDFWSLTVYRLGGGGQVIGVNLDAAVLSASANRLYIDKKQIYSLQPTYTGSDKHYIYISVGVEYTFDKTGTGKGSCIRYRLAKSDPALITVISQKADYETCP
jgi:hypothetical protein